MSQFKNNEITTCYKQPLKESTDVIMTQEEQLLVPGMSRTACEWASNPPRLQTVRTLAGKAFSERTEKTLASKLQHICLEAVQ